MYVYHKSSYRQNLIFRQRCWWIALNEQMDISRGKIFQIPNIITAHHHNLEAWNLHPNWHCCHFPLIWQVPLPLACLRYLYTKWCTTYPQHGYHYCTAFWDINETSTMFIQELKLIRCTKSRPSVWIPWTQSRELGDKSPEEKLTWPYTSKFNRHAKNHSLLADDIVKDTLRSRPSLLYHISHTWAYLIF